jgi:hypothetical protein
MKFPQDDAVAKTMAPPQPNLNRPAKFFSPSILK